MQPPPPTFGPAPLGDVIPIPPWQQMPCHLGPPPEQPSHMPLPPMDHPQMVPLLQHHLHAQLHLFPPPSVVREGGSHALRELRAGAAAINCYLSFS